VDKSTVSAAGVPGAGCVVSGASARLEGLDGARGFAMLLVCLSHFGDAYLRPLGLDREHELLTDSTLAATPAFILVSGLVLGCQAEAYAG